MKITHFPVLWLLSVLLTLPVAGAAEPGNEQILLSAGGITVTEQDLQQELLLLPADEQAQALAQPDKLKELLRRIYLGKRLVMEAQKLELDKIPLIQARLAAVQRQTLSETLREYSLERAQSADFTALAREHYAVRRDEFQLPERFKVAHILKKVQCACERDAQRQQIEQLLARLQAGEDFAALAKAESQDTGSAAKGGDLGDWLKADQLVPPFAEAMSKLNPGQLSDVVETEFGFHIIKLLDRQPARLQSFEEAQPGIEQRLQQSYVQEQLRKQAAGYLPGPDAQYDEAALDAILHKNAAALPASPATPAKTPEDSSSKNQ